MLSPKATNRVPESFGGIVTVIATEQTSFRPFESVTVHVTVLGPGGNDAPDAGVQVGPTSGGAPPETVGRSYTIAIGPPVGESFEIDAGHVSRGPPGSTTVGCDGESAQA
jgi:hypothetical protein